MTTHASGAFDVTMFPQAMHDTAGTTAMARMALAKRYHGDLDATGAGEMIAAGTSIQGSAGYVAMERVEGVLQGRTGTFVLQHSGTMNRGAPRLSVTVVPDSGTGELAGLAGDFDIQISAGQHNYEFRYTLPESADPSA